MPLYEYECEACKQRFEVIQKFSDPPPETCAHCGKGPVHRQISTPAIQFKGSGWYITDYAGGRSSSASSSSAGDGESKTESKAESKKDGGEAKPAASSSTKTDTSPSSSSASSSSSKSKD
jgi:putative FmdB family regulatory protein